MSCISELRKVVGTRPSSLAGACVLAFEDREALAAAKTHGLRPGGAEGGMIVDVRGNVYNEDIEHEEG
ncbi:hypothetical protein [Cohnella hongkongensis]|uniref:Uncharacterized protein n=1 Tax=Cohnella hongkongensis TaxID=178337 RepID=A0ABV9FDL9_9BACL